MVAGARSPRSVKRVKPRVAEGRPIFSGEPAYDVVRWTLAAAVLTLSIAVVLFAQRPDWFIRIGMIAVAPLALFFSDRQNSRWLMAGIILSLAAAVIFYRLGEGSLYDWDEAYYAEVARELAGSRQWGTLTFGGFPFWHKPPLYFWLTALMAGDGVLNEFAARFWSAMSGLGVIALTFLLGTRLFSWPAGAGAALLLLAVEHHSFSHWHNFIGQARVAMLETMLTLWLTLSFLLVWEARKRPQLVCWIGLSAGLAVLTKSWPGLAAFGLPMIYALVTRQFRQQLRYWFIAALLMSAVILPWHVWQLWFHGMPFVHDYFVVNVFGRMLGLVQQESHGPFFYFEILRSGFACFAYLALVGFFWALWTSRYKDGQQKSLLLIWITIPLLLFSSAATKLGWYVILIYPAVAVLTAQVAVEFAGRRAAVASVAVLMGLLYFRLPVPSEGSPDVKQFSQAVMQIVAEGKSIQVYSDRDCRPAGTMTNYVHGGIWNIAPSFVYYLDRPLSCTNLKPHSTERFGDSYLLVDQTLLEESESFDLPLLQRGRFVLLGANNRDQENLVQQ
jgi:4-amino-4-deoxy-L-arabinose transferase-like glycosyltransferase